MKSTEILNKIKEVVGLELSEETKKVKLAQERLSNGTILEAESFEPGSEIFIVTEDEKIALPIGDYEMESGEILVIAEEGIIGEIKAAEDQEEEPVIEAEEDVEIEAEAEAPQAKKIVESISKEVHFSDEQMAVIDAKLEAFKMELLEELKSANEVEETNLSDEAPNEVEAKVESVELSATENEPIYHNPEAKQEAMGVLHKTRMADTTLNRIFKKLNS